MGPARIAPDGKTGAWTRDISTALKLAKRRCPDAVFLPVDFPVYEEASARVMAA